ncbi:hypothetical protein N8475_10325 [Winogradskyella sp.]|nr:hypothetical protein [Winogradskyella sp.]
MKSVEEINSRILVVLSGNLSTTPRAVKTILSLMNYVPIQIVLVNRLDKWEKLDQDLIKKHDLEVSVINLGRKPFLPWLKATIKEKLARLVYPLLRNNLTVNAWASNKSSIMLWHHLKTSQLLDVDLILGFSGGGIYPVFRAAQKLKKPFILDIEDYYPEEFIAKDPDNEKARREYLLKYILPKAKAITSASPLIGQELLNLINSHPNHQVLFNSFSQFDFVKPVAVDSGKINCVWFSQQIGPNRGLEELFQAANGL